MARRKVNQITVTLPQEFFKDYARGRECLIRVARAAGYACADVDTTVLCHPSVAGLKAIGSREASVPDIGGAWGCHVCHDLVDGRRKPAEGSPIAEIGDDDLQALVLKHAHLEGVIRTIDELVKAGVLPNP